MSTETPETPDDDSTRFTDRMTNWLKNLAVRRKDDDLHEALAELIEDQRDGEAGPAAAEPEYQLLQNIAALRERTVADCMTPRADVIAINVKLPFDELTKFVIKEAHSRYPVYRDTLDDVIGVIILKDVMAAMADRATTGTASDIETLLHDVMFVPTSMPVMRLLLQMRQKRHHLAMVVDEYGGVDGIVTIEDLVEQIVGEIEDEHDENDFAAPVTKPDGSLLIDGRMPLDMLEQHIGTFLTDDERNSFDTVNGMVLSLADRVPARGVTLTHDSGVVFEVVEADARRIKKLRVRREAPAADTGAAMAAPAPVTKLFKSAQGKK